MKSDISYIISKIYKMLFLSNHGNYHIVYNVVIIVVTIVIIYINAF